METLEEQQANQVEQAAELMWPPWVPDCVKLSIDDFVTEELSNHALEVGSKLSKALKNAKSANTDYPDVFRTEAQLANCETCNGVCRCAAAQSQRREEVVAASFRAVDVLLVEIHQQILLQHNVEAIIVLEVTFDELIGALIDAQASGDAFIASQILPEISLRLQRAVMYWCQVALFVPLDIIEHYRRRFAKWEVALNAGGVGPILECAILALQAHWDHPLLDHLMENCYDPDLHDQYPMEPISTAYRRLQILSEIDPAAMLTYAAWAVSCCRVNYREIETIRYVAHLLRDNAPWASVALLSRLIPVIPGFDGLKYSVQETHLNDTLGSLMDLMGDLIQIVKHGEQIFPSLTSLCARSLVPNLETISDVLECRNLLNLFTYPPEILPHIALEIAFAQLLQTPATSALISKCFESSLVMPARRLHVASTLILKAGNLEQDRDLLQLVFTALQQCITRTKQEDSIFPVVQILCHIVTKAMDNGNKTWSILRGHVFDIFDEFHTSCKLLELAPKGVASTPGTPSASPAKIVSRSPLRSTAVKSGEVFKLAVDIFYKILLDIRKNGHSGARFIRGAAAWTELFSEVADRISGNSSTNLQLWKYDILLSALWGKNNASCARLLAHCLQGHAHEFDARRCQLWIERLSSMASRLKTSGINVNTTLEDLERLLQLHRSPPDTEKLQSSPNPRSPMQVIYFEDMTDPRTP